MNIYRMIEDGESVLIKADSMQQAIALCESCFVEECQSETGGEFLANGDQFSIESCIKYYRDQILQSCELIGELKN